MSAFFPKAAVKNTRLDSVYDVRFRPQAAVTQLGGKVKVTSYLGTILSASLGIAEARVRLELLRPVCLLEQLPNSCQKSGRVSAVDCTMIE